MHLNTFWQRKKLSILLLQNFSFWDLSALPTLLKKHVLKLFLLTQMTWIDIYNYFIKAEEQSHPNLLVCNITNKAKILFCRYSNSTSQYDTKHMLIWHKKECGYLKKKKEGCIKKSYVNSGHFSPYMVGI